MLKQIFEELKESQGFLSAYSEIVRLVHLSRFKEFLEARSRTGVSVNAPTHTAALQGAWSTGYTECLMDILYFKERYLADAQTKPPMTFGMLNVLEKQGDLMPEELDAIRNGTEPTYPNPDPELRPASGHTRGTGGTNA